MGVSGRRARRSASSGGRRSAATSAGGFGGGYMMMSPGSDGSSLDSVGGSHVVTGVDQAGLVMSQPGSQFVLQPYQAYPGHAYTEYSIQPPHTDTTVPVTAGDMCQYFLAPPAHQVVGADPMLSYRAGGDPPHSDLVGQELVSLSTVNTGQQPQPGEESPDLCQLTPVAPPTPAVLLVLPADEEPSPREVSPPNPSHSPSPPPPPTSCSSPPNNGSPHK